MTEPAIPEALRSHIGRGAVFELAFQGMASETWLVSTPGGNFVLKRGRGTRLSAELAAERRILHALERYQPFVPTPVAFVVDGEGGLLLTSRLPGKNLVEALQGADEARKRALVSLMAHALGRIHDWSPRLPKPIDWFDRALAGAERRQAQGKATARLSLTRQFPDANGQDLIAWLRRIQPTIRQDLVFCHGDACMPNFLVANGTATGAVDWAQGRYADRRFDLATACWSIGYNLGDENYQRMFLEEYGYTQKLSTLKPFEALYALE